MPKFGTKRENISRFLQDILATDEADGFEFAFLRNGYQENINVEDLEVPNVYSDFDKPKPNQKFDDWYYDPNLHGFSYNNGKRTLRRTADSIVQLNALVLDFDGVPLEEIKDKLPIKPHYIVKTRPFEDHYQAVFKLKPIRTGNKNREGVLDKAKNILQELAEKTGADPDAVSVNQLFRLPYAPRQFEDGIYFIEVIEENTHSRYGLSKLGKKVKSEEKQAKPKKSTFRGYKETETDKKILNAPPIKEIKNGMVRKGSRNKALVALAYSYAMAGIGQEKAREELSDWAENHTENGYRDNPERPATVVDSCYRNPKGLDWKILASIETEAGEIGIREAKKVNQCMPGAKQKHERKSLEERENRPLLKSLSKLLKHLKQVREFQGSVGELAEKTDIPYGTLKLLNEPLRKYNVKTKVRRGTSYVSNYRTSKFQALQPSLYYDFIQCLGLEHTTKEIKHYYLIRFKQIWEELLAIFQGLIEGPEEFEEIEVFEAEPVNQEKVEVDTGNKDPPKLPKTAVRG